MNGCECWKFLKIRLFVLNNKLFNQEFSIHDILSCPSCNQKDHNFLPLPLRTLFILYFLFLHLFCSVPIFISPSSIVLFLAEDCFIYLFCWTQPVMVAIPFVFYLLCIRVNKKYDNCLNKQGYFSTPQSIVTHQFDCRSTWNEHTNLGKSTLSPYPKRKEWRDKLLSFDSILTWSRFLFASRMKKKLYRERFEQRKLRSNLVLCQGSQI